MEVVENREWVISQYVDQGIPTSDHLKLRKQPLNTALPEDHVLVRINYISIDPYLRSQMNSYSDHDGLHMPPFPLHQVLTAVGAGEVIGSESADYSVGDVVIYYQMPVAEYAILPAQFLHKFDPATVGVSVPDYLSALGVAGFAAWVGLVVVGNPKPGETVFVSAAAGGVGVVAGQLAKLRGCRVVGSVGSDAKVKLLKEEIGYDEAFNYNVVTDFDAALTKYFPNGIDIYLDNVGGKMLEAVLNHVNRRARIPLCGMISQYNKLVRHVYDFVTGLGGDPDHGMNPPLIGAQFNAQVWSERDGVRNLLNVIGKEVRMEGFMIGSYINRNGEFLAEMLSYIKQGKLVTKNKTFLGIDTFLETMQSLFTSSNVGKVILQVNHHI